MAKKGQIFHIYSKELKREVVRLQLEEGWSYRQLCEHFGIKSPDKKVQRGESLKDQWGGVQFGKGDAYWKVQMEWLKAHPNLYEKELS